MNSNILLCLTIIISGTLSTNAPICEFRNEDRTYICRFIRNTFPKVFYGNYNLKCERCNIGIFSPQTFPHDNSLISFNVSDSGIQYLTTAAFSNLKNVQYVLLQNNKIINVSKGAFSGLRQVYQLQLQHNLIEHLVPGFLNDLEVNSIILDNNKLTELQDNIFEGVLTLLTLSLKHNNIKKLHKDTFAGLDTLEYLELQNNHICSLPLGLFKDLKILRILNLSDNKLTRLSLGTFSGLTELNALLLANNSIQVFDGTELLPLQHLTKLDISGNNIYYLDSHGIYVNVPSIRFLHIEENIFSCSLLMNVLQYFKSKGIEVVSNRGSYYVQNINGVACTENIITEAIPYDFFLRKVHEDTRNQKNYC